MSSNGQIIGGIVGAVVGFLVTWNPYGAFQGAAIGAGIGGYLDPPKGPTVSGPRLADLSTQTSTYGAFIPHLYGTVAVSGNILWLKGNKLTERSVEEESGGKGGGSTTTTELFEYSATFAVGLCEGPIAGIKRVWCADKLIYNAGSDDLETIIASNQTSAGFNLYLGTQDQEPDPLYEADVGVGNAPAFRGMAYIVFDDFKLADYSNTLQAANFKFEIVSSAQNPLKLVDTVTGLDNDDKLAEVTEYGASRYLGEPSSEIIYQYDAKNTALTIAGDRSIDLSGLAAIDAINSLPGFQNECIRGTQTVGGKIVFLVGDSDFIVQGSPPAYISSPDQGVVAIDNELYLFDANRVFYLIDNIVQEQYDIVFPQTDLTIGGGIINGNPVFFRRTTGGQATAFSISASGYTDLFTLNNGVGASHRCLFVQEGFIYGIVNSSSSPAFGLRVFKYTTSGMLIESRELTGGPFVSGYSAQMSNGIISIHNTDNNSDIKISLDFLSDSEVSLASIIQNEVARSVLLDETDIDVSDIIDTTAGYRVTGGTIRAALEPLQGAWPFDVIQSGYKIKCVPRGQSSVASLTWEDLGASNSADITDILMQNREMDSQLPARVNIKYLDAAREYNISEQYSERLNTQATNRIDREMPVVMNANKAAKVAEVLTFLPWLERTDFSFKLPPSYIYLEPADVVTVAGKNATYELRLTEINYGDTGVIECKAKPNRAALYDPNASGSEAPGPGGNIPLGGPSLFVPLDIPVVDDNIQDRLGFVGAMTGYTDGWPGAVLIRSIDGGQTWQNVQAFVGKASIGFCTSSLTVNDGTLIDQSALRVIMVSGDLTSVTRDQMLSGINYAAYGINGRWEIVRFQTAALQSDGTYSVSGFVRGQRGTEWATGLHQNGDYFILLDDSDNLFIGESSESLALSRIYRGITSGATIDTGTNVNFTYNGVNLEPLSVVYPDGVRDGSSNITVTWTRRSRLSNSWWTTGTVAPVGESTESYEVDVMNGSTVVRTITSGTPSITYSAENQKTDFGSPQASITFRIYQMSATVGRGYPLEVTL